ncbi:MAG: LysE family translocator [Paracoccaceae bacterium]
MFDMLNHLALAWAAYAIGAGSPGPSTLLIASTSADRGRRAGGAVAAGILAGSLFWGILATAGFAAALSAYAWLAQVLRVAGGIFLIYLAVRAAQAAWRGDRLARPGATSGRGLAADFGRGAALHLGNAKAVFVWLAVVGIGVPHDAPGWFPFVIVLSCGALGMGIFGGYALLFATKRVQLAYNASKRFFDAMSAATFGAFGFALLLRRA